MMTADTLENLTFCASPENAERLMAWRQPAGARRPHSALHFSNPAEYATVCARNQITFFGAEKLVAFHDWQTHRPSDHCPLERNLDQRAWIGGERIAVEL